MKGYLSEVGCKDLIAKQSNENRPSVVDFKKWDLKFVTKEFLRKEFFNSRNLHFQFYSHHVPATTPNGASDAEKILNSLNIK